MCMNEPSESSLIPTTHTYMHTYMHAYIHTYICNELGGGRRRLESDATDDGLSGFPKEQQTQSGDGI